MRGERLQIDRCSAIEFMKILAKLEGQERKIRYQDPYPNGGGIPMDYDYFLRMRRQSTNLIPMDCVGAVFTGLGCDRVQRKPWPFYFDKKLGYGYVNCNTAIKDARGPKILFREVFGSEVKAGDLVCFPGPLFVGHGHIGFLTGNKMVVHCSPTNAKKLGHALAETSAEVFLRRKDRAYLRYLHWADEQ